MTDQTEKENSIVPVWKVSKEQQDNQKKSIRKRILLIALIIVAAIIAYVILVNAFKSWTRYTTVSSIERMDSEAARFVPFGEDIIRYSNDGASLTDLENNVLWSQSFEMQSPIVSVRGDYIAFADQEGKSIYVMSHSEGFQTRITTELPIVKADVDTRGNIAVLMKESDVSYLGMYNISGTKIAEGAIHFESSGFPLDLSLSPDGNMMAVSSLTIANGQVGTSIHFYRFTQDEQENGDNLAQTLTYDDTVIPRIHYLDNNSLIAYGDNKVIITGGSSKPEERSESR